MNSFVVEKFVVQAGQADEAAARFTPARGRAESRRRVKTALSGRGACERRLNWKHYAQSRLSAFERR